MARCVAPRRKQCHEATSPPLRRHGRAPRQGISLIETSGVIAAAALLTAVTASTLISVMQADRQLTMRFEDARAVDLLLDRIRSDIHAAESIVWRADAQQLRLSMSGAPDVTYEFNSRRCDRRTSAAADAETRPRQASFRAPPGVAWSAEPAKVPAGQLVTVRMSYAPAARPRPASRRPIQIDALVGRDARLVHQ